MNPCKNQGVCTQHTGNYTCQCPEGLTGVNCETGVFCKSINLLNCIMMIELI